MKKILLILLSLSAVLFSACGEVKYEFKNGIMYADGKKATGTFEFKVGSDNKGKGTFVNGIPDGIFERYYFKWKHFKRWGIFWEWINNVWPFKWKRF